MARFKVGDRVVLGVPGLEKFGTEYRGQVFKVAGTSKVPGSFSVNVELVGFPSAMDSYDLQSADRATHYRDASKSVYAPGLCGARGSAHYRDEEVTCPECVRLRSGQ